MNTRELYTATLLNLEALRCATLVVSTKTYDIPLSTAEKITDSVRENSFFGTSKGFYGQLVEEIQLFERLMYKYTNQHRHAVYWRHLKQIRRDLRLVRALNFSCAAESIGVLFPSYSNVPVDRRPKRYVGPPHKTFILTLTFSANVHAFLNSTIIPMHQASRELFGQFAATYFMPFSLVMASMVARFHAYMLHMIAVSSRFYGALHALFTIVCPDSMQRQALLSGLPDHCEPPKKLVRTFYPVLFLLNLPRNN